MKRILFSCCFLFLAVVSFAQPSFIKDTLDNYIKEGMKKWDIPGLSIVIVKDGKVVMMKGYGVKDIKTNAPVDENTLFMIASNSKLFTATGLAQLEYDKKLSLDDKITNFFPWYQLYDSTSTALVTVRDMLGHHIGTKTFQGDFTFWNSNLNGEQIMRKMRLLKPSQNFRQSYGYCNSCVMTAGKVLEKVSGKTWDQYITDSILTPLGMSTTHPLGSTMAQMQNASKAYTNNFTGKLIELPYDDVDGLAPAGAIVSNVNDISHWLLFQLDSGKYNGTRIMPWRVLQRTREMQTIVSSRKSSYIPQHFYGYGLGIFEGDYNGRQFYEHTGGADGFVSNVCFVPEENLGISILTNNDNQDFFEALKYQILDAYLGVNYVNRSDEFYQFFKPDLDNTVNEVKGYEARLKHNKPVLNINDYAGVYSNELYGPINIELVPVTSISYPGELLIHFNTSKNLTGRLRYMDNDEWLLTYNNIAYGVFPIKFKIENNKVVSVDIKVNDFLEYDPYTFIKQ